MPLNNFNFNKPSAPITTNKMFYKSSSPSISPICIIYEDQISGSFDDSKTFSVIGHTIGTELAAMCDDFDAKLVSINKTYQSTKLANSFLNFVWMLSAFYPSQKYQKPDRSSIGIVIGHQLSELCDKFDNKLMLGIGSQLHSKPSPFLVSYHKVYNFFHWLSHKLL